MTTQHDWDDFWYNEDTQDKPMEEKPEILDYMETVPVTLTRNDWNWFVTLMTDSINKMEKAVEVAGMDAQGFMTIDVLRKIRNEIARQSGLEYVAQGDASEAP